MYAKLIFSVVLIAFVAVQLVQGNNSTKPLQCYNCNTTTSCRNAVLETCDQKAVNGTFKEFSKYFYAVSIPYNTDYRCLKSSYTYKNKTVLSLDGCVNFDPCKLTPFNETWKTHNCKICKDKNGCNPAGTFSSSISVMILSVFGFVIAKLCDM